MFNVPLPSLLRVLGGGGYFLFLLPDIWGFVFLGETMGLKGSQISSEKNKKNKKNIRWQGHIEPVRKISESHLLKTAWTFGLLCGKAQKSRLGIVITWF